MRKDGKLQNWVVDTWTRQKQKLVNGKNTVHVRTRNGLSHNDYELFDDPCLQFLLPMSPDSHKL